MDTAFSWNTRDRQLAQDRPSLRYESLNELRYVSRLTKAAITCAKVRVKGEHSYPWPLMTRHRVAIFSRHRFSRRDLHARRIFTRLDQPRNKLKAPGNNLDASKSILLPPSRYVKLPSRTGFSAARRRNAVLADEDEILRKRFSRYP